MSLNDQDLRSVQQARVLVAGAHAAQRLMAAFSQEQIDAIVDAMAEAVAPHAEPLARLAQEESTFGNVADKTVKNRFAAVTVHDYIRPMRTVGILREDQENRIVEIAEPMGVVAAIVPCTNPTSTAIYKALIAVKARDARGDEPASFGNPLRARDGADHGRGRSPRRPARRCARLHGHGEPRGHAGADAVAASPASSWPPAASAWCARPIPRAGRRMASGPGNVPVYLDRSADAAEAVAQVIAGKTFDYGTLCSSEQALVCDQAVAEQALAELRRSGAHFLNDDRKRRPSRAWW